MSFILQYRPLFKVSVQENGSGLGLPGFSFKPTWQTQKLLANHQLIFRPREAGFEVYYKMNPLAADPLLGRISKRIRLSFSFLQADAKLLERYEPDLTRETGPQFYFDNLAANGSIQPDTKQTLTVGDVVQSDDAMKVYPPVFSVQTDLTGGGTPPTLQRILDKFNPTNIVLEANINGGGASQVSTKIDMSSHSIGPYVLKSNAIDAASRTIYITNEPARRPVLGFMDIYWEEPQDRVPTDGVVYLIRFLQR